MNRRLGVAVEVLFVLTEALAWYYAMHVASSVYERNVLRDIALRIDLSVASEEVIDAVVGARASEIARAAAEVATAGPPLYLVLAVAGGAYALTRYIRGARLGRAGSLLGILVSVVALSLAWRLALVGDLRFWDFEAVARFFEDPNSQAFLPVDPYSFSANPDPGAVDDRASGLSLLGILALWLRFLYVARSPLAFEGVLRSFSATFPVVVIATVVGSAAEVPGGGVAVLYFTLGVLTLALANARRGTEAGAPSRLDDVGPGLLGRARVLLGKPWAFAAASTLLLVLATAAGLLLLSTVNAGAAIFTIGALVGRVLEIVLIIIVTPVYLLGDAIGRALGIGSVDLSFIGRALDSNSAVAGDEAGDRAEGALWWLRDVFRLVSFAVLAYGVYRLARYLFRRLELRQVDNADGDRSSISSIGGMGSLLRAVFPGRAASSDGDPGWMRRHAAYWLYGRAVRSATERRFAPRPGETPLEFAAASATALGAPVFEGIAREFDRARYGRHFASEEELLPYVEALRAWELANPVTDEVRRRPGRDEEAPDIEVARPTEAPEPPPDLSPL